MTEGGKGKSEYMWSYLTVSVRHIAQQTEETGDRHRRDDGLLGAVCS